MPKKQKIEEYLRFGQIIRIHGNKCLPEEEGDVRGMITVKGFTDKDAKYTTFTQFKDCQFYRESLFQILPRGSFDISNNEEQTRKKIKEYADIVKTKVGNYVLFGQDVVFKHVDSHDYLSGSVRCSDGGLGAFRVELASDLTPDLVFKLEPFRSFEKQGDKIKLESPLRIKNISNRCYISTETKEGKHNIVTTYSRSFTWLIHLHEEHDTLDDIQQIRTHDLLFLIHTKNEGFLTLREINEKQYTPCIKLPLYLTGYPFFTSLWEIQHLSVPKISPYYANQLLGTEGTYSIRQILNNQYLDIVNLSTDRVMGDFDKHEITIASATSSKGSGGSSTEDLKDKGLIKIEGPKALKDGEIDADKEQEVQYLRYRQESPFVSHSISLTKADSENGFRIMKMDEQSKSQVLFILSTFEVLQKFNQDLKKPIDLFEATMKTRQLLHIDQTLQKLIAFIKNCKLADIEAELLPVKKLQYICMQLKICEILFSILAQIGTKILDEIYKHSKQQNEALKTVFNRAYYFIWQIIKGNRITKLYVCEDWLDIILDHAIQLEEDTVHACLNEILRNNDEVVTKFLSEDGNKLVQRIINIFALKPPHEKFLNIFSASCISDNLPIVANQTLILTEFLKRLDPTSSFIFKYDILHQMIEDQPALVEEEKKVKIKTVYVECYISKDQLATRRLMSFFEESGRIDLYQTSNYFIAYLNILADICYGKNTEAKKYVEKTLQPLRYEDAIGEPEETAEVSILDILVAILQDDQMQKNNVYGYINLQRAALRLITFAYIESADLSPVLRINRYRNLDRMLNDNTQKQYKFNNIMQFIKNEITNFKSFYADVQEKIEEKEDKQDEKAKIRQRDIRSLQVKMRLFTILDLLKSTLINGMWTIQEQQNQILPLLLNILKNSKDDILENKEESGLTTEELLNQFQGFKTLVSKPTPSVEKIIECKALACELIEIIFDFRFNNLVTQSVKFYKDLEEEKDENLRSLHKISLDLAKLKSDAKAKILYNSTLWEEKMSKILNKEDPQSEKLKEAFSFLIPLMVQLSIHRNSRLFFRSLRILKRHFQLTSDIKNLLLRLSLFDNRNGYYLASSIMQNRKLFNKLEEESLLYVSGESPYLALSDFLAWLSESIKIGTDLKQPVDAANYFSIFQHFTEESRIDKFHQRLIKNTDLHPLLLKFLGLSKQPLSKFSVNAKAVLKYVYRFLTLLARNFKEAKNEMIHIIEKVKTHVREEGEAVTQRLANDLRIQLGSTYLGFGMVIDNELMHKLRDRHDCEAILFLTELFTDNKDILYNQVIMQNIANEMSELINKVPIEDYYKSHILDFMRSLIYFKDRHIVINQGRILAKLQDSKKYNIHYRFDKTELNGLQNNRTIKDLIVEWQNQNERLTVIATPGEGWPVKRGEEELVILMPELTYFITLMNLFSNLVEGKQIVNIGKCRQVHSYSTLMHILSDASLCYPLKAHLRNYVNELYYSTQIQEDLCVEIINLELPLLINDLNTLIIILSKERSGRYKIMHPIRYKYLESYIYLYIEQIAYSMNYLLSDETFLIEIRKQLDFNYGKYNYYLHYFLLRIYERLRWILNYYYGHKYIRGFLNKITNKMKEVFLIYFKDNALNVFDKSEEKLHDPNNPIKMEGEPKKKAMSQNRLTALRKRSKKLLHKLVQAEIENYFTEVRPEKDKNFPLTFFLPYDEDEQPVQKEATGQQKEENQRKIAQKLRMMLFSRDDAKKRVDYHSLKLSKLREELHSKDSFIVFMKGFMETACKELFDVNQFFKGYYKFSADFISFKEYIRIFVQVNTNSPSEIPTDLKIYFFQILLQFITKHNTGNKLQPIESWNKTEIESETVKNDIILAQNFLAQSNVAELLIETLKNATDLKLIFSILQFGISFLLGGNTVCQNAILQRVKEDTKNELFLKIQSIISKLGKKISSKIAELLANIEPRSDEFVVQSIDRYDYYDQPTRSLRRFGGFDSDKDEEEEEILQKRVFGCLFKFMQLLCECNNIEFKNFIREQKNTDGSKKNNSINILNMTTFQIRRLFKVMDKEASIIILPLTDFLNEVVSLPCRQNQIALCDTTFFEDLCYMSTFFQDPDNKKAFGFDVKSSLLRLYQLYQKCILIVLNVLEGNSPALNKSFLIKLDVKFLLQIIKENLERLEIKEEADLKKYFYDKAFQSEHLPVELENAINVMIVLLKLQDSQGSEAFLEKKRLTLLELRAKSNYPLKELLLCLEAQILKIEIVSTLGRQNLYFPKHPILTKLSDATRNRIMEEVSRSTQREKIKSLMSFKEEIFTEIGHNFQIQKKSYYGMEIGPAQMQKLYNWMFNISYIIIIFWFITTDVIIEFQEVQYFTPRYLKPIILLLDSVQLFITVVYFILYYKIKFPLADYRAKKEIEEEQSQKQRLDQINNKGKVGTDPQDQQSKLSAFFQAFTSMVSSNPVTILLKFDQKFFTVLLYLITSLFGTFVDQKLILLYILYYFMMNQNLENVFKAITFNLNSLFSVGLLGFVFVYIFCLIFYQTYALQIAAEKDQKTSCDTIYECILDLYVSGSIGGSVEELEATRFTTDLIYFIFFELLFSNIVSGIMIDTFAELRSKREEMTDDKKNKCYICGRNRGELEKGGEKFDQHIKTKHFLWNYIYYIHCLMEKNETEYSGLEYEIRVCLNKKQTDEDYIKWIPFGGEESDPNVEKVLELIALMQTLNMSTKQKLTSMEQMILAQAQAEQVTEL